MRATIRCGVLTATLLALAPGAGAALDWTGRVGVLYDRTDTWPAPGSHHALPNLSLDLGGSASGSLPDPGILDWSGAVNYRRDSRSFDGTQTRLTDALAYRLGVSLLDYPASPISASAFANRTDTRVESHTGTPFTGSRTADSVGGSVRLAPRALPRLELSYRNDRTDETLPVLGDHESSRNWLNARFAQSAQTFNSYGSFTGEWNDGTWVYDKNDNYLVTANATARLGEETSAFVSETFYRRVPNSSAPEAFSQNLNSFSAGARSGRIPGEKWQVRFLSREGMASTATASSDTESTTLDAFRDFRLGESGDYLMLVGSASRYRASTSVGTTDSAGGDVGADYAHRRTMEGGGNYELAAGPRVGYVTASGADDRFGYGAAARASITTTWNGYALSGVYSAGYGNNLSGRLGWLLEQRASGTFRGRAGSGSYALQLNATARRGHSPTGDEGLQSLALQGDYRVKRLGAYAQIAISNGILAGTPSQFIGDGLFLPVGYNTHSTAITIGGNATPYPGLTANLEARYGVSSIPGQPQLEAAQGIASISYRFGLLELTLEDRVFGPSFDPSAVTSNLLMLRAARTFGSRF